MRNAVEKSFEDSSRQGDSRGAVERMQQEGRFMAQFSVDYEVNLARRVAYQSERA